MSKAPNITTPVGSFGKGVKGSITLNFSTSGGANCDVACRHHPLATGEGATRACYAVHVEKLKPSVNVNLTRKESAGFAATCNAMATELRKRAERGDSFPWARLSAFGSVPQPATLTDADKVAFGELLDVLASIDAPVHFPVESLAKVFAYGDMAQRRGIAVRLSLQSDAAALNAATANLPVSWVAGERGQSFAEKMADARSTAKARKDATGRNVVICPAVVATLARKGRKVSCGECTACANASIDVCYPLH